MKKSVTIILCFIVGLFSTAYPQDSLNSRAVDKLFELSLDDLLNVVITPSKLAQSVNDVTQKVDLISAKEIETLVSGNRNICETISRLPGASVSVLSRNDANWGTYGGIGPKFSTYMLQGLPIDAFIDPMSLDLNAIDHIEVQRGPASVIYPNYLSQDFAGSQSPLAGTVNLILKDKIEQQKTSFQTSLGSYNTLNSQVYHQGLKNQTNYFFGATYEMSDYTNYGSEGSWLNMKKEPEYEKTKLYFGLTIFMDKHEKQKLTVFCQETFHNGDAGRVYKGFKNQYGTINVGYEIELNDRLNLQSHLGVRTYNRSWQESNFGVIDTLKSNNGVEQLIVPFDISLSISHSESSSLIVGLDYQRANYSTWTDPLNGHHDYGNISTALQGGVYVQEEYRPITGLTIRGGLRYSFINNTIVLENFGNPDKDKLLWDRLLWSAGAKYAFNDNLSVYLNLGSSFSTPGLKSIGGTLSLSDFGLPGRNGQLPNPDLKPENGIGSDAGFDFIMPAKIKICIRGFYTKLQNGIIDVVVSQNPSQTQSINAESTTGGAEIEVSQRVNDVVSWYANGTYLKSNVNNKLSADQNQVEIPFSPDYVFNLGGTICLPFGMTISPSVNHNGGYYDGISKTNRTKYVPGLVINSYVSQKITINKVSVLECFAQLYNLTNNDYDMPWQFKNPGFSCMIGIKVTF
ncbi:MAG: TonB-dependent receptor [Bacteroidales bacterium]|nr:TonB-dependent receptor [Bacteroidales bacterium]